MVCFLFLFSDSVFFFFFFLILISRYDDPSTVFPSNGQWQSLAYPVGRVPVFVKAGAIIPLVPYTEAQALGSASQNYNSLEFAVFPSSTTQSVNARIYLNREKRREEKNKNTICSAPRNIYF